MNETKRVLLNSAIAAGISFCSAWVVVEEITLKMLVVSFFAAGLVFLNKIKDYFSLPIKNKKREKTLLFDFL